MTENRKQLARNLLQEAVYASRARQASGLAAGSVGSADPPMSPGSPGSPGSIIGQCGLGQETVVDLELSPRGEELFHELWARETPPTELENIRRVLTDWVELQDAFDRKRNHFLRDFRKANGFDRREYTARQSEDLDAGLERVNSEVALRLEQAGEELLAE